MSVASHWTFGQIFAVVFSCVGVYIFIRGLLRLFRSNPETGWHKVRGKIVSSKVELSYRVYRAEIRYVYEIQGLKQESSGIAPIEAWSARSTAAHFVDKYPAGSDVWVYVDPSDLGRAVLEPKNQPIAAIAEVLLGVALGSCGFIYWMTHGP